MASFFTGADNPTVWQETLFWMPVELKIGRYKILDYDEKLLGRELATDDRA
jgi:hypothetical protein